METIDNEKQVVTQDSAHVPDVLPILSLSDLVVFPNIIVPMVVTNEAMVRLVNDALGGDRTVGCFTLKPEEEDREREIYQVGTCCQVVKMFRVPDGSVRLLVRGMARILLKELTQEKPYPMARVEKMRVDRRRSLNLEALTRTVAENFRRLVDLSPSLTEEVKLGLDNVADPEVLADLIVPNLNLDVAGKQEILEAWLLEERMNKLSVHINRELKLLELTQKIQDQVDDELDRSQKEYYLREQIKAIRKELGDDEDDSLEIRELEEKIAGTKLTEEAREVARKELARLSRMNPAAAEYTVCRTYIDWILSLPWLTSSEESIDINHARTILDEDHYGLEDVKERILEYLAVRKLRADVRGPILCFAGPPGVGKTSLGKSIARALGREFARISLGGIRDEAEIRGHRRTYIGAMPGRMIQKMRFAGVNNPVFMLDEIDKMGNDFRGDPASALLEVLDPEQNSSFSDHYLEIDFDLSKVLFITTANQIYQIPHPLRDRMEIISLPGYISPEKIAIAQRHLIPRMIEEHGLEQKQLQFNRSALEKIIREYTREAGLRNLERTIAAVCRKTAMRLTEGDPQPVKVTAQNYSSFLGVPKFPSDKPARKAGVGLAYGLAWTPVGGEVLAIECSWMPGHERVHLTGHLGDVMKESADIAMSYLRSNARQWGLEQDFIIGTEVHLHIPEGATPKDGPSAGVTMATALASLFTGRSVRDDLAMTGELTLQGKVLPVGGLREKLVAAHGSRIRNVILPKDNKQDLEEVPDHLKEKMTFHFVESINDILNIALVGAKKKPANSSRKKPVSNEAG